MSYGNTSEIVLRRTPHCGGFFLGNKIFWQYNTLMDKKKLAGRLVCLILFIFLVNFFANKFYWYSAVWWFDMLMHFLGGFWVGLLFIYLFSPKDNSVNSIFKILFFVLTIGIGWEMFEILVNGAIMRNSFNFLDTISDVFFDLAGGSFSILYFLKRIMLQSKDGSLGSSLKDCP